MENESFDDDFSSKDKTKLAKDISSYWIHCNRCYETYIRTRRRILLLACNHIICEKCVAIPSLNVLNGSNEVNCPICHRVQRFRVLCNMMPAHTKELFNPEPWRDPTERVLKFQADQRKNFEKGMIKKHSELEEIRKNCKLMEINAKEGYEKLDQLQHERKQLEREVRNYKDQELRSESTIHLQPTDTFNNEFFDLNTFSGANRERAKHRSHRRRHSFSENISNNFTLSPQ